MNTQKLIATYARVSTAKQEDEQTIQIQMAQFKEFALKNNYCIVKEYADDGWSGDMLARPSLDQMRQDAKAKMWEAVLIYDPDRLARRYSYQELVMDELKEAGKEVIFITVSAPKNSEDKILHGVRGLFAEYERAKISERFRLGKLRKVKEGHILVTEPLYGYTYVLKQDKVHGYYIVNESEARVVRMIFSWVADEGLTLRAIVRRLQELGIKPRKSKRGVWSTSTLSTLLRHKAYIGEAHWGSSYAVVPIKPIKIEKYKKMKKTSRRIRPQEEWISIPVPPLIDKDLFDRARSRLESNYAMCERNKKNEYLLAGKIWCECGRRRAGEGPQRGKHLYYRCSDRVNSFPLPPNCKFRGINARIADKLVWQEIVSLMSSPELMLKQIERWLGGQKNKGTHISIDEDAIKKEVAKLKEHENRYNTAYGAGLFTVEQLGDYIKPVREKVASLEAQLLNNSLEKSKIDDILLPDEKAIRSFSEDAVKKLENADFALRRGIVSEVIEKVIGARELLQVYGFIPIENVGQCSDHRYGLNTNRHDLPPKTIQYMPFEFSMELPEVNWHRRL